MRQCLGPAAALLRRPQLLILDEPTNGLHPTGARDLRRLLRGLPRGGTTVLLSSHDMAEVEDLSDEVTVLHAGTVAQRGTVADLCRQAPAPVHRLRTSADDEATTLARRHPDVTVAVQTDGSLALRGHPGPGRVRDRPRPGGRRGAPPRRRRARRRWAPSGRW
jgi:ABC-2 type transport system ATP-binding protein